MVVTAACDLRHLFGPVRDQGARPTCMAFAGSDAHAAARPGWVPLSCEYAHYYAVKRAGGHAESGATLVGMLSTIRDDGQPPEKVWTYLKPPIDSTLWKPPGKAEPLYRRASATTRASLTEVLMRLDAGSPVIMTMSLSDAFYRPDSSGIIAATEPPDHKRRHAVIAVGHGVDKVQKFVLIRNSWGKGWGIDGHAWISEDYLMPRLRGLAEMREDLTNVSSNKNNTNMRSSVG
jgi:hypothetical protein